MFFDYHGVQSALTYYKSTVYKTRSYNRNLATIETCKATSLLVPGDPGGLGTRIVSVETSRLGQVTTSTGASAPPVTPFILCCNMK
jgi:hypothetical protein